MKVPFSLSESEVAILGLGLMGGSLALALRGHCKTIIGHDAQAGVMQAALEQGVIDLAASFEEAHNCDVLVLATPVRAILEQLERLSVSYTPPRQTVVVDLGSTKSAIVRAMTNLPPRFEPVGGHPMTGKEVSGLTNATADLYREKVFVMCAPGYTSVRALSLVYELVQAIGATPFMLPPERHDALAALTSHLPYAVAIALMRTLMAQDDEQVWRMTAGGFRDTTRVAASDLTMMTDILITNRDSVLSALAAYREELEGLAVAIEAGDADALRKALAPAQAKRAELFKE